MSIQSQLNQNAINMLPKTKAYIHSDAVSDSRAAHHNYVVVRRICNANPCLVDMTPAQLNKFDEDCLEHLQSLDNPFYC